MNDNTEIFARVMKRIENMTVEEYEALYEKITAHYPPPSCGTCVHASRQNPDDVSIACTYHLPLSVSNPYKQRMNPDLVHDCPCWLNRE